MKYLVVFVHLFFACDSGESKVLDEHLSEYYNYLNNENIKELGMFISSSNECDNNEEFTELRSKLIQLRELSYNYSNRILDSGIVEMDYYTEFIQESERIGLMSNVDNAFIKHRGEIKYPLILANKILLTETALRKSLLSHYSIDCANKYANLDQSYQDGEYRFDIAFAEWEGKSMGEKVTVIVKGDSVTVRYEGDGMLTDTPKGFIMDKGKIRKHKSGVCIISSDESDVDLEEVGGCGDGPTVIDFKNEKYWLC